MAVHNDLGKQGEQLAVDYLIRNNYKILHRNWRYSRYEIDIIALKDNMPHFVEVKIRSTDLYGFPEESVTKKKIRMLLQAANEFLYQHPAYNDFRMHILSIIQKKNNEPDFFLLENIYL